MKLQIDFDPASASELKFVGGLGVALQIITDGMRPTEEAPIAEPQQTEEEPEGTPASEEPVPPVAEEKPKRTRRSKKTEEPVTEAPTEEAAPAEEAPMQEAATADTGELPFDTEVNEAPVAEAKNEAPAEFPTMTKDEFTEINKVKRAELGLTVDGEHADLIRDFNIYCQKWANLTFGTSKPSTLPGEQLWQFAQWFRSIQLNPDYIPGSADDEHGCPFLSVALSK